MAGGRIGRSLAGGRLVLRSARAALLPSLPAYLILFVTNRCNARCPFCFVAGRDPGAAEDELSADEIGRTARNWPGLVHVTLTGGEPMLRDDIGEIALRLAEAGVGSLTINTNGSMPGRTLETVEALLGRHPRLALDVNISIDALRGEHDEVRGTPGLYDKAMASAWALAPRQEGRPNFRVGATLTLSASNRKTAPDTIRALRSSGAFRRVQAVLVRGRPRDPATLDVPLDVYRECVRELAEPAGKDSASGAPSRVKGLLSRRVRELVLRTTEEDRLQVPCLAGRSMVEIDPRGKVYPCEMLWQTAPGGDPTAGIGDWALGSLRESDYSIGEIMRGEKAGRVARWIGETGCYCGFECAAYNNLVFSPRQWPGLMAGLIGGR